MRNLRGWVAVVVVAGFGIGASQAHAEASLQWKAYYLAATYGTCEGRLHAASIVISGS